jgi:hypothetical protein
MPKHRTSTSFQPGVSGNPRGGPGKARAFATLLAKAGSAKVMITEQGETVAANVFVSDKVWELLTTGEVALLGRSLAFDSAAEWLSAVKWVGQHLDGPAQLDVTDVRTLRIILERLYERDRDGGQTPAPLQSQELPNPDPGSLVKWR